MNDEIKERLEQNRALLEKTFASVEKVRRYMMWTAIISIAVFVVPLIILLFALPMLMSGLTAGLTGGL